MGTLKLVAAVAAVAAGSFWLSQRYDPQKPHAKALLRCMLGLALICAWNLLPIQRIGVNPISIATAATLGTPGLALLNLLPLLP